MSVEDPNATLARVLAGGREIKLGKGVVAKTGHAILALTALWLLIAARLGPDLIMDGCLLAVGLFSTAVTVWWIHQTQAYARQHPAEALLEGAEFLEYRRLEEQVKGMVGPAIPDKPADARKLPRRKQV